MIREGVWLEEMLKLIDEDEDIGILCSPPEPVRRGRARWLSNLAKNCRQFPIPVAIVPGHLSDEDIDALS